MPKVNVESKDCAECNKNLPIGEFYKSARSKDGHGTWCKACWVVFDAARIITPSVIAGRRLSSKRHYMKHTAKRIAYTKTPSGKFGSYRSDAVNTRGLEFTLTKEEFMLFWHKPCYYCDGAIETVGLDRVDNSKGYVLGNVVSCCKRCNFSKHTMGRDEFINHCGKVAEKAARRTKKLTEDTPDACPV